MYLVRPILAAVLLSAMGGVAPAQTPPAGGDIPIYDITPPVVAVPSATPTPVATATPRATPTPRAVPTPRATPTSRATPAPRPTATPRAVATPEPRATPDPLPPVEQAVPAPLPTASPVLVEPAPVATPEADVPAPAPDTLTPADGGAVPWWLWFVAGIALSAVIAWAIDRRRRARTAAVAEALEPVPAPPVVPDVPTPPVPPRPAVPQPTRPAVPAAPLPPVVPAVPAPPAPPAPPRFLEFQLAPLRVGTDADNALLDFDLTIGNPSSVAAEEVRIATLLLSANPRQDEQIAAFFANPAQRGLDPFELPAGQRRQLEATMALPRHVLHIVTRDRPFFVPMMAIDARYRWADGRESRTTAAFLIGQAQPGGKIAPVFMDEGDRMIDRLEARLHGEVRRT